MSEPSASLIGRREPERSIGVESSGEADGRCTAGDGAVTDAELVRRAQDGDAAAFAGLVVRYQGRVFNTCYRMCPNHADAADLTQSAFLKALEALPKFEARSQFLTWLFRIAVNLCISHRRQRARRPTVALADHRLQLGDPAEPGVAAPEEAADVIAEKNELCGQLQSALVRLPDEFRAALVLKDIEGMDYAAIAAVLEVPLGTVKSRIHRGRLMLRELLLEPDVNRG